MKDKDLQLKKATLEAWTKILLKQGLITVDRYNRMLSYIAKLNS